MSDYSEDGTGTSGGTHLADHSWPAPRVGLHTEVDADDGEANRQRPYRRWSRDAPANSPGRRDTTVSTRLARHHRR
jgi:hypothetical protein